MRKTKRIKNFCGYGVVTATKIDDATCDLHIKVVGNHEWGVYRENDTLTIERWLVRRFDENAEIDRFMEYDAIPSTIDNHDKHVKGEDEFDYVDACDYLIYYKGKEEFMYREQ